MSIQASVNPSQFNMWRAIFAFTLVDDVLSIEEQKLLQEYQHQAGFSQAQMDVLKKDFTTPQDVISLFNQISDRDDKERFCILTRALAWCEGDVDRQEAEVLKKVHCLGSGEAGEIFKATRNHAHVQAYYQQYMKSGMRGLFQVPDIQIEA